MELVLLRSESDVRHSRLRGRGPGPSLTAMLFQAGEGCFFGRFEGSEAAVWS